MIGFHTARGVKKNARKGFFNGSRPPYGYRVKKAADDRGNQKGVRGFEQHILKEILNWAFSEANVKALVLEVRKVLTERHKPVKQLQYQIAEVEGKLARYYEAFEDGTLDPADMGDRVKELKIQKKQPADRQTTPRDSG